MKLLLKLSTLLCVALLLAGCSGSDSDPDRPTANAGPDQTVEYRTSVTLDASGSSSPRNDPLSYRWVLVNKPEHSEAELSDPTAAQTEFLADLPGTYEADLLVNDGTADSNHDRIIITATSPYPGAAANSPAIRRRSP